MSLQNLEKKNNYELFCKKITVDEYDIATIVVDSIIVENATVTGQVTTPHITSGTSLFNTIDTLTINAQTGNMGTINAQNINALNVTTENLSSQTFTSNAATINDLTINNSLDTPAIDCDNLTVNNTLTSNTINGVNQTISGTSTINTLNVNTTLTAPTILSNNLTSTNANISNLTSSDIDTGTITASSGILDTISGTNLTYINGSIDQLNGSNVQYSVGNISDISGSNLNYDVGYIPTLSTKELTITSSIVSCPNATIDNLNVTSSFSTPTINVDNIGSYSGGDINVSQNIVSSATRISVPEISTNFIDTFPAPGLLTLRQPSLFLDTATSNVEFIAPTIKCLTIRPASGFFINCVARVDFTAGNCTNTTSFTAPLMKMDSIDIAGIVPSISILKPINFANTTGGFGTNQLSWYSSFSGTLNTSGCIVTTLNYNAVRVGNAITLFIQCMANTTLATASSALFITGLPSQYAPNINSVRGICLVNGALGAVAGSYQFQSSGQLNVFAGTNGGGFAIGTPCGFAGNATDYTTFSLITNI